MTLYKTTYDTQDFGVNDVNGVCSKETHLRTDVAEGINVT